MIRLGSFDVQVNQSNLRAYEKLVQDTTRVALKDISSDSDRLVFKQHRPGSSRNMTVQEVQTGLKQLGFFPGGKIDGICGYRTLSAIRLFQEYVRSVEKHPCLPDGLFGPATQSHLSRWMTNNHRMKWQPMIDNWQAGQSDQSEFYQWLDLCTKAKAKYQLNPSAMLRKVNEFNAKTDTKKITEWDFDPRHMHMIGIRRSEHNGKFDDIILFLIKGLVFKFQGSTEPGSSTHRKGMPFLVQGQHDYHFGWHRRQYLALRPNNLDHGVLVVRSANNKVLDERDLDNGLEANPTINIHWGGKGIRFNVNNWSAGCQVINGSGYINPDNELVDCSSFVATNNKQVTHSKTRGAYNVLVDLVTALSGDMNTPVVKYMLLDESDLKLSPELASKLRSIRERAGVFIQQH